MRCSASAGEGGGGGAIGYAGPPVSGRPAGRGQPITGPGGLPPGAGEQWCWRCWTRLGRATPDACAVAGSAARLPLGLSGPAQPDRSRSGMAQPGVLGCDSSIPRAARQPEAAAANAHWILTVIGSAAVGICEGILDIKTSTYFQAYFEIITFTEYGHISKKGI